jgi:rhamnogalacturonyl hydrolase YesR
VDNNVFGAVPLELYLQGKGKPYLKLGLFYADTQWQVPANAKPEEKAYADKGYTWQTRIWIDDMFMITAVQAQAYRATGDRKYVDRAAKEMVLTACSTIRRMPPLPGAGAMDGWPWAWLNC